MRQRDGLALLITLLVGVGLGWVLACLGGSAPTQPADSAAALPRAQRPERPVGAPELRGRPEAANASDPGGGLTGPAGQDRAEVDAVIEHVGERGMEEIIVWSEEGPWIEEGEAESLGKRAWLALLTLYAAASRQDAFLRAAPRALAHDDVGPSDVLECVGDAPPATRAELLDALRAALPEQGWYAATVADLYLGVEALDRAIAVLVPALQEDRDVDLAARLIRASPERAATELQALLADGAFDADGLTSLGQSFVGQEQGELGIPFFLESLRLDPRKGDALMALASVDAALAVSHAEGLARQDPADAQAWTWLGKIRADSGDVEAAFAAYKRSAETQLSTEALYGMLEADPGRAFEVARGLSTESDNDEVHGAVAKIALQGDSTGEALEAILRAHASDPVDHEWLRAMVTLDPARALAELDKTMSSYTGDERDEVLGARANALGDLGRSHDAFDAYLEAHRLDKGDWEWQRGMARVDPARALDVLEAYRTENGDEGDLLGAIGDAYVGIGRPDEAMRHYERALEMDGGNEWLAHMARVDAEEATRRIQTAIDEKPQDADLWLRLGETHELAGRRTEATAAYAKAYEIEPRNLYYGAKWARSR